VSSDVMGRFTFDGAEDFAFWLDTGDDTTTPVYFFELPTLIEFLKYNFPGLFEEEWEYGWAGDSQAQTFYDSQEEAEEYFGNPKQFKRRKAGSWEAV